MKVILCNFLHRNLQYFFFKNQIFFLSLKIYKKKLSSNVFIIHNFISLDVINCKTGDGLGNSETYTGLYDTIQQCIDAVKGGLISEFFSFWFKSPKNSVLYVDSTLG